MATGLTNAQDPKNAALQPLFHQVETQLIESELYQEAMLSLRQLPQDVEEIQNLVGAIAREAIQLTVSQILGQDPILPRAETAKPASDSLTAQAANSRKAELQANPVVSVARSAQSVKASPTPEMQQRAAQLQQLGQQIRQLREAKGMTLMQLHSQTYVPMHHLKALEGGEVERLPEDVYIRGFVRRIGQALGADGLSLADWVPQPAQTQAIVPSWQRRSLKLPAQLGPVHLYLGYAVLITSAIGGLAWMTQPTQPQRSFVPADTPQSNLHSNHPTPDSQPQRQKLSQARVITPNMAPPEIMRY